jgi:hypothetical protein
VIDRHDAVGVGQTAERRRAESADPERESEEESRDQADTARHQFLRKHENGRER